MTDESNRLSEQIQSLERRLNEREYEFTIEKTHYEKRLKDLTKRPLMNCVKLQTVKKSFEKDLLIVPLGSD